MPFRGNPWAVPNPAISGLQRTLRTDSKQVQLGLSGATLRQLALMATAGVIGLKIDTLQLWWGVFHFPHGMVAYWLAPLWVGMLWRHFATILPYCIRGLSRRYWPSAV